MTVAKQPRHLYCILKLLNPEALVGVISSNCGAAIIKSFILFPPVNTQLPDVEKWVIMLSNSEFPQ